MYILQGQLQEFRLGLPLRRRALPLASPLSFHLLNLVGRRGRVEGSFVRPLVPHESGRQAQRVQQILRLITFTFSIPAFRWQIIS